MVSPGWLYIPSDRFESLLGMEINVRLVRNLMACHSRLTWWQPLDFCNNRTAIFIWRERYEAERSGD